MTVIGLLLLFGLAKKVIIGKFKTHRAFLALLLYFSLAGDSVRTHYSLESKVNWHPGIQ
jgi:hypothetical protein